MSKEEKISTIINNVVVHRTTSPWLTSPYIEQAVNNLIKNNPIAYNSAQEFGDFIMDHRLANIDEQIEKRDIEGENILYQKIIRDIKQYGFTRDDLSDQELKVLELKLTKEEINNLFLKT
jgi:hypothetical protein